MAEAEFSLDDSLTDLAELGLRTGNPKRYDGDDTLLVKFFMKPREDKAASAQAGRPIFKDRLYISIKVPGTRDIDVTRPASDTDKARFARHLDAFNKHNQRELMEGTPLEAWPLVTTAQVAELKYFNVSTVEQLAGLSDSHAQNFTAINALRTRAQNWLEKAKDGAATARLTSELEQRDSQIAALEQALAEQGAMIRELQGNAGTPDSEQRAKSGGRRGRANS